MPGDEPETRAIDRARQVFRCAIVAALGAALSGGVATAQSPSSAISGADPLADLCAAVGLDELNQITGLEFATATSGPLTCTYASEIGSEDLHSLDLRVEPGQVADLEEFTPGGQRLEVAGRPAYWAGSALWTDFADGLFTVQPLVFEPGVDLLELALPVAALALSRIGPPLAEATDAMTFEEPQTTPAACYGEDAWTDAEGHRISGLPVTVSVAAQHVGDTTDHPWLIIETTGGLASFETLPTLIRASWPEASWSYQYGDNTLLVPGPSMSGTADVDLDLEVVLRSTQDLAYQLRVAAGPPPDPRPDEGTLHAIVRAPDLARWDRLVSASFC
jgi:hypothetical protein